MPRKHLCEHKLLKPSQNNSSKTLKKMKQKWVTCVILLPRSSSSLTLNLALLCFLSLIRPTLLQIVELEQPPSKSCILSQLTDLIHILTHSKLDFQLVILPIPFRKTRTNSSLSSRFLSSLDVRKWSSKSLLMLGKD